ncbi:MAG: glycosyltransferase family 2 protein [Kiritimatiellia bacterium]
MIGVRATKNKETPRVLCLISCHNEQGRVGQVVREVWAALPFADIVVIDDGSTDDSTAEATAAGAIVLRHVTNLGAGAAQETGYLYAIRNGYDYVLHLDGDGQHPAEKLPDLLATLRQTDTDIVIGSRYAVPGYKDGTPFVRELGHRLFAGLLCLLTGARVTDPTSGFRGFTRRALALFSEGAFPSDYPDSDVLLMAHLCGLNIREIPVRMRPRNGGVSMHSGLRPIYYGLKMIFSMFIVLLNWRQWLAWRRQNGGSDSRNVGKLVEETR